MELSQEVRQAN